MVGANLKRAISPWEYTNVKLLRVVDGDTLDFEVDTGFHNKTTQRFRLRGYNSPEVHGQERPMGLAARQRLIDLFDSTLVEDYRLTTFKADSFGRYLCDIKLLIRDNEATRNWYDLVTYLRQEGWGVHWARGQKRYQFNIQDYPIGQGNA